jgi:phosphate ABC transporter permease protein PstC/phosphate ABC transporter permease subunit PstA
VALVVWLTALLFWDARPALQDFGLGFFISRDWDREAAEYGALPFIYGTAVTAFIAMALAIPGGVAVAVFITNTVLPSSVRSFLAYVVELTAAVPSTLIAVWGFFILIPFLQVGQLWLNQNLGWIPLFNVPPSGPSFLAAGVTLGVMVLPTLAAITRDVLLALPSALSSGALALGATRWESVVTVILPAATPGIIGASILALGRALGEAIAVTTVIGNSPTLSSAWIGPGYSIPAALAVEFQNAVDDRHISVLLCLALVLLVLTSLINVAADILIRLAVHSWQDPNLDTTGEELSISFEESLAAHAQWGAHFLGEVQSPVFLERSSSLKRMLLNVTIVAGLLLATALAFLGLGSLLVSILWKGLPHLTWQTFTSTPALFEGEPNGFANAILGTLILVACAAIASIPLGTLTGIYLAEFRQETRWASLIRFLVRLLNSTPTVIIGVFAYIAIVMPSGQFSGLAGAFSLVILMLPTVVLATEEALKLIPLEQRLASQALGADRLYTTWQVVLLPALPGIITGIFLAVARASSEAAPLLFTALFSDTWPTDLLNPVPSLAVLIYNYTNSPFTWQNDLAWTAALVLLLLVSCANLLTRWAIGNRRA